MPSDVTDQKLAPPQNSMSSHPPPKMNDSLPCPRCDSTSTKFCYYNNYNLSQPRHFCKSCRRYWTHGGTLRNVPVGGGTRKNSKRTRSSSSATTAAAATTSSSSSSTVTHEPVPVSTNPVSVFPSVNPEIVPVSTTDVNLNANVPGSGNYTAMLNNMQGQNFLALGGFNGYSIGSGFEELELGFGGTRVWEIPGASYAGVNGSSSGSGVAPAVGATPSGCNTWHMVSDEGGNSGLVGEDCFVWSGLAISTPGQGLK